MSQKHTGLQAFAAATVLLVALAMNGPAQADASSAQYRGCDGYGEASSGGDGMTSYATVLLIFSPPGYGNTDKSTTGRGAEGIADCDAALADLPVKHWMRKANLLRARAVHRLDNGNDTAGALADLDLAEQAAKDANDAFYARSLGLGMRIVRAFALRRAQISNQAQADALALQAMAERPYNKEVPASVLLALGPGTSQENKDQTIRTVARLLPTMIDTLFFQAFRPGHFAEATTLYSQLSPRHEIGRVNISETEQAERDWRDFEVAEVYWASRGGMHAYALAATGKNGEARAAIEASRARLTADTAPIPPLPDKDAKDNTKAALHQGTEDIHKRAAIEGTRFLDQWSILVERRIAVSEGKVADVSKDILGQPLPHNWASVDLLDAIYAQTPKALRPKEMPSQTLRSELESAQATANAEEESVELFFKSLPDAETVDRIPPYEEAKKSWLAMDGSPDDLNAEGYRVTQPDAKGVLTVSFRGTQSTPSIVEEMALLRAADLARQAGKKGLVVVAREDIKFEVNTTYYGSTLRTDPNGHYTKLSVVFVDPAALPAEYQGNGWRVIDADDVYSRLAPLYIPPPKKR